MADLEIRGETYSGVNFLRMQTPLGESVDYYESDGTPATQAEFEALRDYVYDMSPVATVTAPVVAVDDAAPLDAENVTIKIEPKQSGSGIPAPDNVRPISGWTGVNVSRTGVNVWDEEWRNGYISMSGSFISDSNYICSKNFIRVSPSTTYFFHTNGAQWEIYEYDAYKNFVRRKGSYWVDELITTDPDAYYIHIGSHTTITTYNNNVSFNYPATDHSYHAYIGTTIPITFPTAAGTVYGGTLDVTNGKLTVDRANIASYAGETLPGKWISDRDAYAVGTTPTIGAQVVYELATPTVYDLDPVVISMLRGHDTIWADTGDTTLTYRQDVALVLQALTAPDETDMRANTNYAVNSFFTVGGQLYKATSAIATGETIRPGTNCTATTIAEQLTYLYSQI